MHTFPDFPKFTVSAGLYQTTQVLCHELRLETLDRDDFLVYLDWGMAICDPRDKFELKTGQDLAETRMRNKASGLFGSELLGRSAFQVNYRDAHSLVYACSGYNRVPLEPIGNTPLAKSFKLMDWYSLDRRLDLIRIHNGTLRQTKTHLNKAAIKAYIKSMAGTEF